MEQAIQAYLGALSSGHGASANTLDAYHTDLRQLQDFMVRHQVLGWAHVRPDHLHAFMAELNAREYAPTSIARKLAAVKSFFRYLSVSGSIAQEPVATLAAPRVRKELPHTLTTEEIARLFTQLSPTSPAGVRDAAMLHVLYATGMRVSEVVGIVLRDLDVALAHVFCAGRKGRERILPLSHPAQTALTAYLNNGRPQLLRGLDSTALFLNHHGERLTRQGFWLIVKGYARAAGLAEITPHTLRHAFALDMLAQGMELRGVQQLLGHANLSTTQMYRQFQEAPQSNESAADHISDPVGASADPPRLASAELASALSGEVR
jgi:integrase/recombinase XerD